MRKIMLIGDAQSGKTTFMNLLLHGKEPSKYEQTLGLEAGSRTMKI